MLKLVKVVSLGRVPHLVLEGPPPDRLVFPSGATGRDLFVESQRLVARMQELYSRWLLGEDIVLLASEMVAHRHVAKPQLHRSGIDHGERFAEAAIDCTRISVFANPDLSLQADLVSLADDAEWDVDEYLARRCLAWEESVRIPAHERSRVCRRSAIISEMLKEAAKKFWNPDYEQMRQQIDRAVVDNVGGNESSAKSRERLGDNGPKSERGALHVSWAQLAIRQDANVVHVVGGRAQIDPKAVARALNALLGRGNDRKRELRPLSVCEEEPRVRDATEELVMMAELREVRETAAAGGHRLLAELAEAALGRGTLDDLGDVSRWLRSLLQRLQGKSAELQAAMVYEFLREALTQEEVARAYGVGRKALRDRLAEAKQHVAEIRVA
jgi:hypothetical protein